MAVRRVKFDDQGREVEHQRFISVLLPSDSYMRLLRVDACITPAVGLSSLLSLKKDGELSFSE